MRDDVQVALPFWAEYCRALYATPRAWAHKGENLVHAFEVLADVAEARRDLADLRDQALMLAGMAIEVLLKAIAVNVPETRAIVFGTRPRGGVDAELWESFYTHDLTTLAKAAGVELDESQVTTAAGLSQYILWKGRYVVPREKGIEHLARRDLSPTVEGARELIDRVVQEVQVRLYERAEPEVSL
jgi:hypothetical protein